MSNWKTFILLRISASSMLYTDEPHCNWIDLVHWVGLLFNCPRRKNYQNYFLKQEIIPVGCILPARPHTGGLCLGGPPWQRPLDRDPLDRDPLDRDPLDRDPPGQRSPWAETPWNRDPPWQRPPGQIYPMEGTWDQRQRLPRRNMGAVIQTGNDIIHRPPLWTGGHL